jgi:hypothetical protein
MLLAQAEGMHPMTAARDYHIIKGKATKTADAMMASFQGAGGVVEWIELTDEKAAAKFSHPKSCPKPVLIDWDMQRAAQAGLTGKDNWRKYPRAMLRARVVSEGMKAAFPAALSGLYTPEEVRDFADDPFDNKAVTVQAEPEPALPPPTPAVTNNANEVEHTFTVIQADYAGADDRTLVKCDGAKVLIMAGEVSFLKGDKIKAFATYCGQQGDWSKYTVSSWKPAEEK